MYSSGLMQLTTELWPAKKLTFIVLKYSFSIIKCPIKIQMKLIAKILRKFAKLRFKVLGYATIKDIPTDQFNQIIKTLTSSGWKQTYVYEGVDAWIDYGKVKLKGVKHQLTFEWDNWTEGSIEGPSKEIHKLAISNQLKVSKQWRWEENGKKS